MIALKFKSTKIMSVLASMTVDYPSVNLAKSSAKIVYKNPGSTVRSKHEK